MLADPGSTRVLEGGPAGSGYRRRVGDRLVADLVVERLRAWEVHRLFGYSGDGINAVMGALRRAGGDPAFVQARHERTPR